MSQSELGKKELERYSRHLLIPEVGRGGQLSLKDGKVLLIGAGGLGSPAAVYLASAGVGTLGIVDFDRVEASNLHRQILHFDGDVGKKKTESARETLTQLNPHVQVITHDTRLHKENALSILGDYDVIIDGTDNFPTRYLVNDACVLLGKPNVYGSIFRFDGQASVFDPRGDGPCYRCLYPEPPPPGVVPSCAEGGVLGVLPGIIGVIQATEAIKIILGKGDTLTGRLLLYNALEMSFHELKLRKDPHCPLCGTNPTVTELIDYEGFCRIGESEEPAEAVASLTVVELKEKMEGERSFVLLDVRESHETEICQLTGSVLIPLGQLANRMDEVPRATPVIAYCKKGIRGEKAVRLLNEAGFTATNLEGGIIAWAEQIDPEMARY